MAQTILSLRNVEKVYRTGLKDFKALDGVNLDIGQGKMIVVLGPSGAGKSTLLNLIGGMDIPTAGSVLVGGEDIARYSEKKLSDYRAQNIGFIFQFYNILPSLTVLENVELVREIVPASMRPIEALEAVGLAEHKNKFPAELSGGEQQRVSIARAIAKKPTSLSDGSGIYITERLAQTISKKVGDTVRWHVFGEDTWYTSKIVGTLRDPQMQSFTCNKAFLSSLGREYAPDTLYTNADLSGVKSLDGATQIMSIEAVQNGFSSMLGAMYAMIALLIVISTVLGFVIVYNLGGLSFTEKQYQFATLKVLGFRNSQIKKIFVKQNIWLTVIAVLIAMPLGYYMVDYFFTEGIGGDYDFPAVIGVMSYLYATVGTAIVSLLVNLFLARKVKKIDMVTSLKGNE